MAISTLMTNQAISRLLSAYLLLHYRPNIKKTILPPEDLSQILMRLKLDPEKRTITYCGGGYFGAHAAFVLYLMGFDNVALYDGSLMEWASDPSNPMESEP